MRKRYAHESGVQMTVSSAKPQRKATNISLDVELLNEAKALGINISRTAELGLREAVVKQRAALWQQDNKAALEASNSYVDRQGIPLALHRKF